MRTTKWLVSIVVALVLIVGVGAPFLIGIWIQKIFPKIFLGPTNASSIRMTLIDYKRGFFSSTAKVAIGFNNADTSNRIVFDETIQHGPLVFENGPILALALVTAKSDDPNFKANSRTIWKLNKQIISTISIPSIDVAKAPIHFSLQNLNMNINYHSIQEILKANATVDKIELQGSMPSPLTIILSNITSSQNLNRSNHIWYGSRTGTVGEISISSPQGQVSLIHNLIANGTISEASDKTNIELNYKAQNSSILNNPIDSLDFEFTINNLDTKSLSNLIEKAEAKKEEPTPLNTRELSDSAMELISKGVLITLDHLSISTKQGVAKADGKISIPALGAGNIFQLIAALKIDFNLQVPKNLMTSFLAAHYQNDKSVPANTTPIDFAQKQIAGWIQEKVLIPGSNDLLMMKVQFENAKLLVNGVEQHQGTSATPLAAPANIPSPTPEPEPQK